MLQFDRPITLDQQENQWEKLEITRQNCPNEQVLHFPHGEDRNLYTAVSAKAINAQTFVKCNLNLVFVQPFQWTFVHKLLSSSTSDVTKIVASDHAN